MQVDEGEALMYGDEDNVDQEQINLEHQEQEQAIVAGNYQVWPINHFFSFSFFCPSAKSMTSCQGSTFFFRSYQQLPCLCIGPLMGFTS